MLVLSRRPSEAIVIDQQIRITVLSVSGSSVRLGIEAPPEIAVHRDELLARLETDSARSAAPAAASRTPRAPNRQRSGSRNGSRRPLEPPQPEAHAA